MDNNNLPIVVDEISSSVPVLGGLESIKDSLSNASPKQQLNALKDALNYGKDGIDLLLSVFENRSTDWRVLHGLKAFFLRSGNSELVTVAEQAQLPLKRLSVKEFTRLYQEEGERDFRWVDLSELKFGRVVVPQIDLSYANCSGVDFYMSSFVGGNFTGTNFTKARLGQVNFRDANLDDANLSEADVVGALFHDASMFRVNLANALVRFGKFKGMSLDGANLAGANFEFAVFYEVDFGNANINQALNLVLR